MKHAFIAPDLGGRPTGGTLYNARLIGALRAEGVACDHATLDDAARIAHGAAECVWVDSLYLDALPDLRATFGARTLQLIVHYLPSLVARGRLLVWDELSQTERTALAGADGFLVTSEFMRAQLSQLEPLSTPAASRGIRTIACVEPGCELAPLPHVRRDAAALDALMLCNVVEAKGVLGVLEALASDARDTDRFALDVVGGLEVEPAYVAACRRAIDASALLRERVTLRGALPHAEALACLGRSDVLLSASRMESYGMALAEARAAGVPIVARRGGNTAALVAHHAGGALVDDERGVAAQLLALVRDRDLLAARTLAARTLAPACARSWRDAARELLAQRATAPS